MDQTLNEHISNELKVDVIWKNLENLMSGKHEEIKLL